MGVHSQRPLSSTYHQCTLMRVYQVHSILNITSYFMNKILLSLMALFMAFSMSSAQKPVEGLRLGKLPNGLSYYIYRDAAAEKYVNFYLFQNVGGIVEADNQSGLAHFLEHMAFNATEHYPDGIMSYLRKNGIYTFNAITGINETVYHIDNIPTDNAKMTEAMMLILKDWSHGIKIRPQDVEKERGIVIEEWRSRRNVDQRLTDAMAPIVYNNTLYAHRNVIGSEEVLRKFTAKDLKRFYDAWYRPDLQCVMIIGDINPDEYEAKVKKLFGSMSQPKNPQPRTMLIIPDNKTPHYKRFIDPENKGNSFGLYQRSYLDPTDRRIDFTQENLNSLLFNRLAPTYFSVLRNAGREDFVAASVSHEPLVRAYYQVAWDVVPYHGRERSALKQLLQVRERLRREGFTAEEFEAARVAMYEDLKGLISSKTLSSPSDMMDAFKKHYLYGAPIRTLRQSLEETSHALLEMEVEDLNSWVAKLLGDDNLAFMTFSAKAEDMNMSLSEFQTLYDEVKNNLLPPAPVMEPITRLLDFQPKVGQIVVEKTIKDLEAKEWTLSNGAKVIYKHVPNAQKKFYFVASSLGGKSLVADADLPSYTAMQSLILRSGLHKYDRNQLHGWMKDRNMEINMSLTDYTEGLGGNTTIDKAEDFFQYVHLLFTRQRFDEQVFSKYVERNKYQAQTRVLTGMDAAQDSIQRVLFPASPRNPRQDAAFYDSMRLADLPRLFNDRYGNAGDFTFCLVGELGEAEAKKLILDYISSLPGKPGKPESYKMHDLSSPEAKIIFELEEKIDGDIGEVEIAFSHDLELAPLEQVSLDLFKLLLQNRLFDQLRESQSGVYNVGVDGEYIAQPTPRGNLRIRFRTERAKADALKAKTYEALEDIKAGRFSEQEFKNVLVPLLLEATQREDTSNESEMEGNQDEPLLWVSMINLYIEQGRMPSDADVGPSRREVLEQVKPADIKAFSSKFFDGAKHREIVLKSLAPEAQAVIKH